MKNIINIMLAIIAITFTSSVAVAGDRAKAARDISPKATSSTYASTETTPNAETTPVELSKPEIAIDKAISAPKNTEINEVVTDPYGAEPIKPAVEEKKAEVQKKPAHKAKKKSKHRKKKRTHVRKNA